MNTMKWLVKREYWEHKGGIFWAPVIAAIVHIVSSTLGLLAAVFVTHKIETDGRENNIPSLQELVTKLGDPEHANELSAGIQTAFMALGSFPMFVVVFVMFFYCLSSLYDERKDKSILFWKSMPVSDGKTVISKVFTALFIIPAIGIAVSVLTALIMFVIASIAAIMKGVSPAVLWDFVAIAKGVMNVVLSIPVYAVWALPTIGWLMLCSAWARRVPFLWAVVIPVLSGVLVWMLGLMQIFGLGAGWFWTHIVGRLLGGTVIGIHTLYSMDAGLISSNTHSLNELADLLSVGANYRAFMMPGMWIGAALGLAMIYASVRLRRYRDEG
jgi:ABC-2 type transport system permease protein